MTGFNSVFVRRDLVPQRVPPKASSGTLSLLRTRLFSSPLNIVLTILSALLLWFTIVPAIRFLLVDAVWQGSDRHACLAENAGHVVGACWPFVEAKIFQFIYGFYPQAERWRVNLTFLLAVLLLTPLLIPRAPAKALNAGLFFLAFPVVGFFLLHGGGIHGFGVSWTADVVSALAHSLRDGGQSLADSGDANALDIGLVLVGRAIVALAKLILIVITPLLWLRNSIQSSGQPVWLDLILTAAIVSWAALILNGGFQTGRRSFFVSLAVFTFAACVIALLGLDHGGLAVVDTRQWGGLLVTLVVSVTGIVASMPIGIALALGRRATIPLVRLFSIVFIEFWRGVPLITVLFFATYMLPLFLPGNFSVDGLVRVLIGVAIFAGAYNAEVIRGGLQAIPRGQGEAAAALGLSFWKVTALVTIPQALRHVIPGLVNSFISLFKDTTLVLIVAIFDLLGSLRASFADPAWATPTTLFTGFAFAGIIYFVFCFGMSRYSMFVERRLNAHRRQ